MKCQCNFIGRRTVPAYWYDEELELPFTEHEPGECKCANEIRAFTRNGARIMLCSICCLSTDLRCEDA